MTTVALLGLDLILGLVAVGLWVYAAVRGRLGWALAGMGVLVARVVIVLLLTDRGWELAAERVDGRGPACPCWRAGWPSLLFFLRRGPTGFTAPRVALWSAAGASAVSLVLTGVVGYPGGPGGAGHDHSHAGGVAVTDLRTPPASADATEEDRAGRADPGDHPGVGPGSRRLDVRFASRTDPDCAGGRDPRGHSAQPGYRRGRNPALARVVGAQRRGRGGRGDPGRGVPGGDVRVPLPGRAVGHLLVSHAPARPGGDRPRPVRRAWWCSPRPGRPPASTSCCRSTRSARPRFWGPVTKCSARWWRPVRGSRLRLVNTEQQPRRFALNGAAFRVAALDGVELNGPTNLSDQSVRIPAGGRADLAFAMPANPVRLSVEGAP